jgi:hypothetical protein
MNTLPRKPEPGDVPIRVKPSTMPRIEVKPSTMPKLDPADLAAALGAKPAGAAVAAQGPLTLLAVRQELFRRLHSSGGRPGFADADKVAKVPLSEAQWKRLEELAAAVSEEGFSPSAGQVANVLLNWALATLGPDAAKQMAKEKSGK